MKPSLSFLALLFVSAFAQAQSCVENCIKESATAHASEDIAAYAKGFDLLKVGDYTNAEILFREFLTKYPNSSKAPDALYWVGECLYVRGDFIGSAQSFQTVLAYYPEHSKAAGALLKYGLSRYGSNNTAEAQAALDQVIQRYPGSQEAKIAVLRKQQIQRAGDVSTPYREPSKSGSWLSAITSFLEVAAPIYTTYQQGRTSAQPNNGSNRSSKISGNCVHVDGDNGAQVLPDSYCDGAK